MVFTRLITRSVVAVSCLALVGVGLDSPALTAAAPIPEVARASKPVIPAEAPAVTPVKAVALASNNKIGSFEKSLLKEINKARSKARKCGSTKYKAAKSLSWNAKLGTVAENHSKDMSKRNYFSHNTKGSNASPFTRIKKAGYKYKAAGETIAAGYATPQAVVKAWLKSPGHCKVLMNKTYTQIGLGFYKGGGTYVTYTTADFGKPKK
ncbi:MAG: CAP domain-containing protein [Propionicimonas sp.]|uniref:CAP domain-containing protein n=1 Tax=Propionicimonas sp. TaxID=1955623 RepID=UPI002B20CE83|nr:CAP domain-containing protein [Propionicimonas sp.]MEA4943367.1 CAP domain-containing protein [Propionicimonas sp.]